MRAVELWLESRKKKIFNAGEDTETSLQTATEILWSRLRLIREIDASLAYLESIRCGGAVKRLLFILDQTCENVYRTKSYSWPSLGQLRRRWDTVTPLIEVNSWHLQVSREETLKSIGRILSETAPAEERDQQLSDLPLVHPFWISRYLYPVCFYGVGFWVIARITREIDFKAMIEGLLDIYSASKNLLLDWVVTPMQEIWKTIRYRSTNLALVSATALRADMESLERMVVGFAAKTHPEVPADAVIQQVRQGDVTLLLRRYEAELQAPFRNVVLGDLVPMLLIQVQKSKVDLEGAMMAMDRLLKANELNFELLAVIPLLALLYHTVGAGRYYIRQWSCRGEKHHQARLRLQLHRLAVVLNGKHDESLRAAQVLILVQFFLDNWYKLPASQRCSLEGELKVDLQELLDSELTAERKLWTINRMCSYYPMLRAQDGLG